VNENVTTAARAAAADLPVRAGEDPWTEAEVAELRADLDAEVERHRQQAHAVSADLAQLRSSSDGSGDAADVGTSNFERDQEMTLAAYAQEAMAQAQAALQRLDAGTYGRCEHCGEPIGKGRLQVYPRATLCVTCKQREERR